MHLYYLITCLAIPTSLFATTSVLLLRSDSVDGSPQLEPDLAAANTISSSTRGESASQSFNLYTGSPVRRAFFWSRRLDGEFSPPGYRTGFIINKLEVVFEDTKYYDVGTSYDGNVHYETYNHDLEGNILKMTISRGSFVDGISYTTAGGTKKIGDDGGTPHGEKVGNGVLMGFTGATGSGYLTNLTAIFRT